MPFIDSRASGPCAHWVGCASLPCLPGRPCGLRPRPPGDRYRGQASRSTPSPTSLTSARCSTERLACPLRLVRGAGFAPTWRSRPTRYARRWAAAPGGPPSSVPLHRSAADRLLPHPFDAPAQLATLARGPACSWAAPCPAWSYDQAGACGPPWFSFHFNQGGSLPLPFLPEGEEGIARASQVACAAPDNAGLGLRLASSTLATFGNARAIHSHCAQP